MDANAVRAIQRCDFDSAFAQVRISLVKSACSHVLALVDRVIQSLLVPRGSRFVPYCCVGPSVGLVEGSRGADRMGREVR